MATFNEGDRVRSIFDSYRIGTVKAVDDSAYVYVWVHWDGDSQPYTTAAHKIELVPQIPKFDEIWVSQYGAVLRIIGILPEANGYEPVVVYVYDRDTPRRSTPSAFSMSAEPLSFFLERATKRASR